MGNQQIKLNGLSDQNFEEKSQKSRRRLVSGQQHTQMKEQPSDNEQEDLYNDSRLQKELQIQNVVVAHQNIQTKSQQIQTVVQKQFILYENLEKEQKVEKKDQENLKNTQQVMQQAKEAQIAVQSIIIVSQDKKQSQKLQKQQILSKNTSENLQISLPQNVERPLQCQIFNKFSSIHKSQSILLENSQTIATQASHYYQNQKLILTQPISSSFAKASLKVIKLKYCVGAGIALLQVLQKHDFDYKSYQNELSHGLFLVTSQGFSWSHCYKSQDDILRQGFNKMKTGDIIHVQLQGSKLIFSLKQYSFELQIPDSVLSKYKICFCAYLHAKQDSMQIETSSEIHTQQSAKNQS